MPDARRPRTRPPQTTPTKTSTLSAWLDIVHEMRVELHCRGETTWAASALQLQIRGRWSGEPDQSNLVDTARVGNVIQDVSSPPEHACTKSAGEGVAARSAGQEDGRGSSCRRILGGRRTRGLLDFSFCFPSSFIRESSECHFVYFPCRCLCFGFLSQMMKTRFLRRTACRSSYQQIFPFSVWCGVVWCGARGQVSRTGRAPVRLTTTTTTRE